MKRILAASLSVFLICVSLLFINTAYAEDDFNVSPTEGTAYAILTDEGDFIFFRSTNIYTNNTNTTVRDIYNNSYSGTVYTNIETSIYTSKDDIPWYSKRLSIHKTYVAPNQTIAPKSTAYWFFKCLDMESFDPRGLDTSNTADMKNMFYHCRSLTELDVSTFDTSNVTNMEGMFRFCVSLNTLDLHSFNTSKVTTMTYMFSENSFIELDLHSFDTSHVTDMKRMFWGCFSLVTLDLSSFDTSKVQNMEEMFLGDNDLYTVKLGKKWTKWLDEACFCEGTWHNYEIGLAKSETELYAQYPSHASAWAGTWTKGLPENHCYRIYHASRLTESIRAANELKEVLDLENFDAIVIAKDSDFADALSGSYLAARMNAPILLVGNNGFDDAYGYIRENLADTGTIYILGSASAVPASFEDGLDEDADVCRLEGSSRYMTNLEILKEAGMTSSGDIFIVTGSGYADSLSSGSVGLPIMMVDNKSTKLKNSQKRFLEASVTGNIYILGDQNAVNASLESALKAYGPVTRIGGSSRWETTRLIAEHFFPEASCITLATGNDFADGLIASPLAYAMHSPLLMAASDKTYQAKLYAQQMVLLKSYVVGSKTYISDEAVRKILSLADDVEIVEK